MQRCRCGNDTFRAVQEFCVQADVLVNIDNDVIGADSREEWCCTGSERPEGPYTCTKCGAEYETLEDLPDMEDLPDGGGE